MNFISLLFIGLFAETEIQLCVTYGLVWLPALEQDISSFSLESTPLQTRWLFVLLLSLLLFLCLFVCLFFDLYVCFFNFVQLPNDLKTHWSIEWFFSLFFLCLFVFLHVFYIVVLPCSFCLRWFLFLSVFLDYYFGKCHLSGKLLHFYQLPIPCRLLV